MNAFNTLMQHRLVYIFLFWGLLGASNVWAQPSTDSSFALQEAMVIAPRLLDQEIGGKQTTFDSTATLVYQQQSLADLLADESPVFIRSYGLGALATSSFRGGSANHTAVLWNGITLSSPMNGQLDFALVPVNLADEVLVQHGGGSALYGSGAVAGAIQLISKSTFNQGFQASVDVSVGSFSNFRQSAKVSLSQKRFVSSLRLFNITAQNDFEFERPTVDGSERARQQHAELRSQGLVSENKWLLGRGQILSLNGWLQYTDRNIPPIILQTQSLANQADQALRLAGEWKLVRQSFQTYVRVGWLDELLDYADPLAGIDDRSETRQLITESETKFRINTNNQLSVGLHNTYAQANHPNFENTPQQNRTALFSAYRYQSINKRWLAQASARAEWLDGVLVPLTYSARLEYKPNSWMKFKTNASRVYRIPTFNDLYWQPGGNPDLRPEDGYAAEAGFQVTFKDRSWQFQSEVTGFTRNVQDWILWLPNGGFWSPQNLLEVWSRGMESDSKLSYQYGDWIFGLGLITNYVVSTNERSITTNDQSLNRQLIYTPMYSGIGKLNIAFKQFGFTYRHNYVGYRYTSTDNTQYLEPFELGSVMFTYRPKGKKLSSRLFFQINNLWNTQYQVVRNRAMPGIHFNTGISIQFNNS